MKKGFKQHLTTARLVGLTTLALAILAHVSGAGSKMLFFASAIILLAPTRYCQERLEKLAEINGKKLLTTTLFEALFWALFFLSGYGALSKLNRMAEGILGTTTINQATLMNPAGAEQTLATAQGLVFTFLGLMLFLVIFNIANNALSRSLIWSTLTDKKWNKHSFFSFLKLNLAWWAIWLVPFAILAAALSKNPQVLSFAIITLLVIATYFTFFVHTTFLTRHKIGASITHGIAAGIGKFYHLLVPLSFALIVYVIAYQALRATQFLPPQFTQPIMIGFVLLYFSWIRAYVFETLPDFKD